MEYKDMKSEKVKILVAGYEHQCKNYVDALDHAGALPVVGLQLESTSIIDMRADSMVDMQRYSLDDYDGLLLPGGGDMNPILFGQADAGSSDIDDFLDARQMELLREFVEAGKPVLGICRGLQVINVYFGGDLIQDIPTADAHRHDPETGDRVHVVRAEPDSFLSKLYGTSFAVNSSPHQAVGKVAPGLRLAATCEQDGVIEAVECSQKRLYGVQWHPERMAFALRREDTVDGRAIFELFLKQCGM